MVDLRHILKNSTASMPVEYREQKDGEFPPRDRLYEREEDPNVYKEDTILRNLFEHYQSFFEKGIDYTSDGKTWNVYPSGSLLWYFNEAFSLCTKLSIDPHPEEYFIDEYYNEIGGRCTQIERYFVLSIVYALLAVNWRVRRQHLKMMDVLYNFLSIRCPYSIMLKCIEFIANTYTDKNNAIDYEFRPVIDRWGYTRLKVDEGLTDDEEEQMELLAQMRKKVCENGVKYGEIFNLKPESNPPEELLTDEAQPYWAKLREKGFIVADSYALVDGVSPYDATFIAQLFSETLGIKKKWQVFQELWGLEYMAQMQYEYTSKGIGIPNKRKIENIFGVRKNLQK